MYGWNHKRWLEEDIDKQKFSILVDESSSARNEMELIMMFRVMEDKVPMEKFMAIVKISDGEAETIANAIDKELTALDLAGNIGGVRRKLSEKANKEVLYIYCRAHILSLAAASCRNENQVKRFFHVLKDIYKMFSKSPKKENNKIFFISFLFSFNFFSFAWHSISNKWSNF